MTWSCPLLQAFWEQVLADVNQAAGTSIPLCPETMLLNVTADPSVGKYTNLFMAYSTYYARKEMMLSWKSRVLPTITTWRNTLNAVLTLYEITYIKGIVRVNSTRYGPHG